MLNGPDYVIFPDTNVLLDLYRRFDERWTKVAQEMHRAERALLVTQQVVDELTRQRFQVVRDALSVALREVTPPRANLPPGLRAYEGELREACLHVKRVRMSIDSAAEKHLVDLAGSTDQVTVALGDLLKRPMAPSDQQLERARRRKECGNPPGKPKDPLGDQLSWEQLLDQLSASTKVIWIVTRDSDFTVAGLANERRLNPFLEVEVANRAPFAEVRLFDNLPEAVNQYLAEVGQEEAFSPTELEYFAHDDDEPERMPWECLRDGAQTPIESLTCCRCGHDEHEGYGEEVYAVKECNDGYEITLSADDDRSTPIVCSQCHGTVFEVEFGSVCSYCENVGSKD